MAEKKPEDGKPTPNPEDPAPAGGAPAGGDAGGGGEADPYIAFATKEAFDRRLQQATRRELKELGIDPDQYKKDQEALAQFKADEEKRKKEAMSEIERAKTEAAEATARAQAAEEAQARAKRDADIARLCAKHGIRDAEYVTYRLADVDEKERDAWLKEKLEDPTERARFGIGVTEPEKKANTSTTTSTGDDPPRPEDKKQVMVDDMTPEQYRAYRQKTHGF